MQVSCAGPIVEWSWQLPSRNNVIDGQMPSTQKIRSHHHFRMEQSSDQASQSPQSRHLNKV